MTANGTMGRIARWQLRLPVAAIAAGIMVASPVTSASAGEEAEWTIARVWNEQLLEAIRSDFARPPVHARNLYHVSVAMYDVWCAYDSDCQGVIFREKVYSTDAESDRHEAISYAAFRLITHRFALSPGADTTLPAVQALMDDLGYDTDITTTFGQSAAAVGNRAAARIIEHGLSDGSNEPENYAPIDPHTGEPYEPANAPLVVETAGAETLEIPNSWQSIWLEVLIDQTGNIIEGHVPEFVGPHWGFVTPFALTEEHLDPEKPGVYLDPGPPPMLGEDETQTQEWIDAFTDVVVTASVLDPDLPETINISPAVFGNNPLGSNDGEGHGPTNPVTGEPYEPNEVLLGDYGRIIAEFWADGPLSSTPPGHWNEIANMDVSDHPDFEHRLGGTGPILDRLEWDVKLYLAVNGAAHDAAVACWGLKGFYDWVRPISAIRFMAENGQSSDPRLPSYHPHGLPLIDGIIELITEETIQPGGKHEHLAEMLVDEFGNCLFDENFECMFDAEQFIGDVAVMGWPGPAAYHPNDPETLWDEAPSPFGFPNVWTQPEFWVGADGKDYSGVRWIRGTRWTTYQLSTFITPPFAGYTSGHTTFSRAIAEVLTELTGSHYFPGGLAEYHFPAETWLHFEEGPSEDLTLQWTSYFDASDQSARSRIYGGIHPYVDDIPARFHGHEIGLIVAQRALDYINGEAFPPCPADFSGSGMVNVDDLLMMLNTWGPCPVGGSCPGDITGDDVVGLDDLILLLNNWGLCPQDFDRR